MSTTATPVRRVDALIELGGLREQAMRLNELAEALHAKTSAVESFLDSVFSTIDPVALAEIEGGDEIERLFNNVQQHRAAEAVDRMRTLEFYEATTELNEAVEAATMRERERS